MACPSNPIIRQPLSAVAAIIRQLESLPETKWLKITLAAPPDPDDDRFVYLGEEDGEHRWGLAEDER